MKFERANPFRFLSTRAQTRAVVYVGVLALAISLLLNDLGRALITPAAPYGLVSLELARDAETKAAVLASWDPAARVDAALSLGLDYLFLACYATFLSLLCLRIARKLEMHHPRVGFGGVLLAWVALAAGLADAVENTALIPLLRGPDLSFWPALAFWGAVVKFGGVALVIVFCIWGWFFNLNAVALHQFREAAGSGSPGD